MLAMRLEQCKNTQFSNGLEKKRVQPTLNFCPSGVERIRRRRECLNYPPSIFERDSCSVRVPQVKRFGHQIGLGQLSRLLCPYFGAFNYTHVRANMACHVHGRDWEVLEEDRLLRLSNTVAKFLGQFNFPNRESLSDGLCR